MSLHACFRMEDSTLDGTQCKTFYVVNTLTRVEVCAVQGLGGRPGSK